MSSGPIYSVAGKFGRGVFKKGRKTVGTTCFFRHKLKQPNWNVARMAFSVLAGLCEERVTGEAYGETHARQECERGELTLQVSAEVRWAAVAPVSCHGPSSNLHHVGRARLQALYPGGAALRCHGVGDGLALSLQLRDNDAMSFVKSASLLQ